MAATIVVQNAELAQSYIAQARSSRRPSPSRSSSAAISAKRRNRSDRRRRPQQPQQLGVPDGVLLRQPGRQALPSRSAREARGDDDRRGGWQRALAAALERRPPGHAVGWYCDVERAPAASLHDAGEIAAGGRER